MEVIQQPSLRVDRRLAGVEVLRFARPDQAPAEAGDVPRHVVDGEDEACAKARAGLLRLVALGEESGLEEPRLVDADRGEVRAQEPDLPRGESQAEAIGGGAIDLARGEVLARRRSLVVLPEHALEILLRRRVGFPERFARIRDLRVVSSSRAARSRSSRRPSAPPSASPLQASSAGTRRRRPIPCRRSNGRTFPWSWRPKSCD